MPFQITASTKSSLIHEIIVKAIDELNRHEKIVFNSNSEQSTYMQELSEHPIIKAILQTTI